MKENMSIKNMEELCAGMKYLGADCTDVPDGNHRTVKFTKEYTLGRRHGVITCLVSVIPPGRFTGSIVHSHDSYAYWESRYVPNPRHSKGENISSLIGQNITNATGDKVLMEFINGCLLDGCPLPDLSVESENNPMPLAMAGLYEALKGFGSDISFNGTNGALSLTMRLKQSGNTPKEFAPYCIVSAKANGTFIGAILNEQLFMTAHHQVMRCPGVMGSIAYTLAQGVQWCNVQPFDNVDAKYIIDLCINKCEEN